jgi:hypothetical protein
MVCEHGVLTERRRHEEPVRHEATRGHPRRHDRVDAPLHELEASPGEVVLDPGLACRGRGAPADQLAELAEGEDGMASEERLQVQLGPPVYDRCSTG